MKDYSEYTLQDIFDELDEEIEKLQKAPYTQPKKDVKTDYYKIKDEIIENHHNWTNRTLAFYQGAAWALASLDAELEQDYIVMCETVDGRLR